MENDLGILTWNIPRTNGRLVWEIGVNNRSASEISSKKWAAELNNAQVDYPNADGTTSPWRWNLNFDLAELPAEGDATLTIAYASAGGASQGVFVNSNSEQLVRFFPPAGKGNAFLRQSNYGKYSIYKVKIPVNRLQNRQEYDRS